MQLVLGDRASRRQQLRMQQVWESLHKHNFIPSFASYDAGNDFISSILSHEGMSCKIHFTISTKCCFGNRIIPLYCYYPTGKRPLMCWTPINARFHPGFNYNFLQTAHCFYIRCWFGTIEETTNKLHNQSTVSSQSSSACLLFSSFVRFLKEK